MKKNLFTYKKSGVDINAADKFIKYISKISSKNRFYVSNHLCLLHSTCPTNN